MLNPGLSSLLWFFAVLALIPVVLWLLKRTPLGGVGTRDLLRQVAALPLSTSQRIVTIEVGQGDARRWLVLGVTPQNITTLHTMEPPAVDADAAAGPGSPGATGATLTPFAQLLSRLRSDRNPR